MNWGRPGVPATAVTPKLPWSFISSRLLHNWSLDRPDIPDDLIVWLKGLQPCSQASSCPDLEGYFLELLSESALTLWNVIDQYHRDGTPGPPCRACPTNVSGAAVQICHNTPPDAAVCRLRPNSERPWLFDIMPPPSADAVEWVKNRLQEVHVHQLMEASWSRLSDPSADGALVGKRSSIKRKAKQVKRFFCDLPRIDLVGATASPAQAPAVALPKTREISVYFRNDPKVSQDGHRFLLSTAPSPLPNPATASMPKDSPKDHVFLEKRVLLELLKCEWSLNEEGKLPPPTEWVSYLDRGATDSTTGGPPLTPAVGVMVCEPNFGDLHASALLGAYKSCKVRFSLAFKVGSNRNGTPGALRPPAYEFDFGRIKGLTVLFLACLVIGNDAAIDKLLGMRVSGGVIIQDLIEQDAQRLLGATARHHVGLLLNAAALPTTKWPLSDLSYRLSLWFRVWLGRPTFSGYLRARPLHLEGLIKEMFNLWQPSGSVQSAAPPASVFASCAEGKTAAIIELTTLGVYYGSAVGTAALLAGKRIAKAAADCRRIDRRLKVGDEWVQNAVSVVTSVLRSSVNLKFEETEKWLLTSLSKEIVTGSEEEIRSLYNALHTVRLNLRSVIEYYGDEMDGLRLQKAFQQAFCGVLDQGVVSMDPEKVRDFFNFNFNDDDVSSLRDSKNFGRFNVELASKIYTDLASLETLSSTCKGSRMSAVIGSISQTLSELKSLIPVAQPHFTLGKEKKSTWQALLPLGVVLISYCIWLWQPSPQLSPIRPLWPAAQSENRVNGDEESLCTEGAGWMRADFRVDGLRLNRGDSVHIVDCPTPDRYMIKIQRTSKVSVSRRTEISGSLSLFLAILSACPRAMAPKPIRRNASTESVWRQSGQMSVGSPGLTFPRAHLAHNFVPDEYARLIETCVGVQ